MFVIIILGGSSVLMVYHKVWIGLVINLLVMGFVGYIYLTTYYLISDKLLKVKCGFMINRSINIDSIKKISETNNPLSSPANSFDRLEIRFSNAGVILVSPKDKMGFIHHLKKLNPQIEMELKNKELERKIQDHNHQDL